MAGGSAFRLQIDDASFRGDLQTEIFVAQNVERVAFDFEEVLAFDEAFGVVNEVVADVELVVLVEFGELRGRQDGLIAPLHALDLLREPAAPVPLGSLT